MKSTSLLTVAAFGGLSAAYPNIAAHLGRNGNGLGSNALPKRVAIGTPPFDAEAQYISNTGDHAFQAPGPNDQRGPCPGLNAMANHGYLPRNGIATIAELIEANTKVFNMGVDLATILAVYGAVMDGDLTKWSIGGPDSRVGGGVLGLLGTPQGISGSHNKYEGDNSPTRGDLYTTGNDYKLVLDKFQELYDAGKADDNYDLQMLSDLRHKGFQNSIKENPYFFNAPFSGVVAQPAAWAFVLRFMGNHSEEHPSGKLNGELLKSFYGITGDDGNFQYTPGHERIPDNWYTRNAIDAYDVVGLNVDALFMTTQHLEFVTIGGNTGKKDSFVGVDPANLTSNVFNVDNLLQGNNLLCYGLQSTIQILPDILSGLFTDVDQATSVLGPALNNATNSLGCPALNNIDKAQFGQFPGYTDSYNGYKPVEKGLLGNLLSAL